MRGSNVERGLGAFALVALSGCNGGIAVQSVVVVVTLGIFVGTIFLDRS